MPNDLTKWLGEAEGEGNQLSRYAPPPAWSRFGMADRRDESRHVRRQRGLERRTLEGVASEASAAIRALAKQQRLAREVDGAKLAVERAHRMSQIIAADTVELSSKLSLIDDSFFQQLRIDLIRPDSDS